MNLDNLSIFTKDTDATEVIKGYEYQKLRTVEDWLKNYLSKNNKVIYCDYEEDIFQRDIDTWVAKFTQIKLYSSKNFSFNSEEVTKAISHFFLLFVKGEYKFDGIQFVFETNASVARKYGDNEADLLEDWKTNQNEMSDELIQRCLLKVKGIVTNYVQKANVESKDEDLLEKVKITKDQFEQIPNEVWIDFTNSIRWDFADISADQAVENAISNIYQSIAITGFPAALHQKESVFARLYYAVAEKSIEAEPENRKLDNDLLDNLLLDSGENGDKGYNEDYKSWSESGIIEYFKPAEFYQVINATQYCRYAGYLKHHSEVWIRILEQFIAFEYTPLNYRQKAIYELLWVTLYVKLKDAPEGTLIGREELVRQYFRDFKNFTDHQSLDDVVSLLGIVQGSIALGKSTINVDETFEWRNELQETIGAQLRHARDENEACYFHELLGDLLLPSTSVEDAELDSVFEHFDTIVSLLDRATLYNVVRLSERINAFIKILIRSGSNSLAIERLEHLSDAISPYAAKKSGSHALAQQLVSRGVSYIHSKKPKSLLLAINLFHEAKALWRNDQTKEGYVLALLNISQFYNVIGCNFAAKYYALVSAWHCSQNQNLHKRLPQAFALVFYADFQIGAWITCLEDFRMYIVARSHFNTENLNINDHETFHTHSELATIFSITPRLTNQLNGLLSYEKLQMGAFYEAYLKEIETYLDENLKESEVGPLLVNKLNGKPLNDIGKIRTIQWNALGISWSISFENDWLHNSVGEEFIGILQILCSELALLKTDLHLLKAKVEIYIEISDTRTPPERIPSNRIHKWIIKLPIIQKEDLEAVKLATVSAVVSLQVILDEISLLPQNELFTEINNLFNTADLAGKTLPDFLYQRIQRNLFGEELFNKTQRNNFQSIDFPWKAVEYAALKWNGEISKKYNQEKSLELIRGRYDGASDVIYKTLENLKSDKRYPVFIESLKGKGWLDWQIVVALSNHIVSNMVNDIIQQGSYTTEEDMIKDYEVHFRRITRLDGKDNYISLSMDDLLSDFESQLNQLPTYVLERWELEHKAKYPDFIAIRDFLNVRFNFNIDDMPESSPL